MDPLVCALCGSGSLIQQGLRTLELCVDNLQPDYLYEHMAPVRAQLMRGLWQCISGPEKVAPQVAFRILGKFGASNRKMLIDPQALTYREEHLFESPAFQLVFGRSAPFSMDAVELVPSELQRSDDASPLVCELTISEVVRESVRHLRSPFLVDMSYVRATSSTVPPSIRISSLSMRQHAFQVIRGVILGALVPTKRGILTNPYLKKHITSKLLELRLKNESSYQPPYQCSNRSSRSLYIDALLGLFYATAAILQQSTSDVMDLFCMVVRQLTVQMIFEQFREKDQAVLDSESNCMDGTVLIDAVILALTDPCKEVCQTSLLALKLIRETAVALIGNIDKAVHAPFFQQILDRAVNLCYREPWCGRLGGCLGIQYILKNFSIDSIFDNIDALLNALFEVLVGLMDDVSSSAVDIAMDALDLLLQVCFEKPSVQEKKKEAVILIVSRIIENLTSPSPLLRKKCQAMLAALANLTGSSLFELILLRKEALKEFVQNGMSDFKRMSLDQQIAFEDAFVFVVSIRPVPLKFSLVAYPEQDFTKRLISICNATEQELMEVANYKPSSRLMAVTHRSQFSSRITSLRLSSIRALVACCIASCEESRQDAESNSFFGEYEEIFGTVLKCLTEETESIQNAAFSALKEALSFQQLQSQLLQMNFQPMISVLPRPGSFSEKIVSRHVLYLLRLFPSAFKEAFRDELLDAIRGFPEPTDEFISADDVRIGENLLQILAEFPFADARFVPLVIPFVCKWEAAVSFNVDVSWRYPLMKYLSRFPLESLQFFVSNENIIDEGNREVFRYLVKHEEAQSIREILMEDKSFVLRLLQGEAMDEAGTWTKCSLPIYDMEMLAMKLIASIGKRHPGWAGSGAAEIVRVVQTLWNDKEFRNRYTCKDYLEEPRYDVPRLAALIMLRYFKSNIDRIDIIFDLCQAFTNLYISDFTFLRMFIEKEVVPKYPIEWRQNALKRIVGMFEKDSATAHDMNVVKMLQHIVIPSLHYAFERYDVDVVVGTPPKPDDVDDNNLISLVCQKVLDRTRFQLSDAMLIQLFHLGCLFVSNCPTHIHDFSQKDYRKQGNRLRILMLLGWPCLSATPQDQTMKYMGHLLIANIINQFNINRKIVLQVFLSLLKATHSDPKDIIKRSLDILTPAVPIRMDDGHKQLMTVVKKTIVEECHNMAQLYHCMSMIVRHYKIYYHVRHQMLQVILNGTQRLMVGQGSLDNRRITIDVCEMVIKWEQWRLKQTEDLEKGAEASKQSQVGTDKSEGSKQQQQQQQPSTSGLPQSQSNDADSLHRPIEKAHVDHVVNLLVRLSSVVPDTPLPPPLSPCSSLLKSEDKLQSLSAAPTQQMLALEQLSKRCLGLLRACLKSNLWGLTATLKLTWLEKQLTVAAEAVTQQFREQATISHHLTQLQTSLDIITHLVNVLPAEVIVTHVKTLQRGIVACLNCQQNTVMRSLYQLIAKLFERTKSSPEGLDELDTINQFVTKFINDTFTNYEKGPTQPMTGVFGTIHLLRTICSIQPAYVDTMCLNSFTKALQKLVREHVSSGSENKGHAVTELIIYSLELLRPRIHAVAPEVRRNIGQGILTPLIDKTPSDRVLDVVIRVVDVMVRNGGENQINQGIPLLIRLVQTIDGKKHQEKGIDLLPILLSTVIYIYESPHLRTNETTAKLNSAFHWGLCVQDEKMRSRFFKLFDERIPRKIYQRLSHIMGHEDWAEMQNNFWIRHCINLVLWTVMEENKGKSSAEALPTRLLNCASFWPTFEAVFDLEALRRDHPSPNDYDDQVLWVQEKDENKRDYFSETSGSQLLKEVTVPVSDKSSAQDLQTALIAEQQVQLLEMAAKFCVTDILPSFIELVHSSNELASRIWVKLFPSLWSGLNDYERSNLGAEMVPFLASGCHLPQRDQPFSATATFLEAAYHCEPPIAFDPLLIPYIAVRHHAWYRGIMMLEKDAAAIPAFTGNQALMELKPSLEINTQLLTLNSLIMLYSKLSEFDQYQAAWKRRAYFELTSKALDLYSEGDFELAEEALRKAIDAICERVVAPNGTSKQLDVSPALQFELDEWHKLWTNCERELGEWNVLLLYGNTAAVQDLTVVADAAWHIANWQIFRDSVTQLEGCTPPELYYKHNLYKAMLLNHQPLQEEPATELLHVRINRELDAARDDLIRDWKRLPDIISQSHIGILQAANQIQEVHEASIITSHSEVSGQVSLPTNPVGDVKSVIKAWRNRACALSDPLSFWIDIHQWRIQHYNTAIKLLQPLDAQPNQVQTSLLPLHSAAHSQLQMAHAARKAGLINVAINCLARLHTLPSLPAMDAYLTVKEHLKCLLQRSAKRGLKDAEKREILRNAYDILENTSMNAFPKENIAKLLILRGIILSKLENYEEANNTFTAAAQLHESVSYGNSVWLHWAEHLEDRFDAAKTEKTAYTMGVDAFIALLEGARVDNELRARKFIARSLWLMKKLVVFGGEVEKKMDASLEKYGTVIPPTNWLPWLPQLIAELQLRPSPAVARIISYVGEQSEQQVFYAIASAEPLELITEAVATALDRPMSTQGIPVTSRELFIDIIAQLCQRRPAEISSLYRIINELNNLKENWLECKLREVNHFRDRVLKFAYENRKSLVSLSIPECYLVEMKNWNRSLLDFGEYRDITGDMKECAQSMATDFEALERGNVDIIAAITVLVKWSSQLATKVDKLPNKKMLRVVSPYLAAYSCKTANVEIFNEHYSTKIKEFSAVMYRFMPHYFIVRRGDMVSRRISIRALNGKVYSYYLTKVYDKNKNPSGIHQLFAMINHFLIKEKETCRRFLQICVPHFAYFGEISLFECPTKPNSQYPFLGILNNILKNKNDFSFAAVLIKRFYDRLAEYGSVTNELLLKTFHEITSESILPIDSFSKWIALRYDDATQHYILRRQVVLHMAVLSICEYILHLNPATVNGLCLNLGTGQTMNVDCHFALKPETLELETSRVVPYRLSSNLNHFFGLCVEGLFNCSVVATVRCLKARRIDRYALPFLWDAIAKLKQMPLNEILKLTHSGGKLLESRLNDLCEKEILAEYVAELTQTARADENLARVDPRLHPWF